ncbi:MAG: hypothetical protein OXQ94_03120 [Gemmatimonadota bacterium]|nr:hypothetical protein [Gemmatimonadota bacterium]MDE2870670.1 hypothetical protein [Gemmatimonadota bacterium]
MIAWIPYAALVGGIVAIGGWALERLAVSAGWPRRFAWLAALTLAVAVPLAGRTRAPVAPPVLEATTAVVSLVSGAPVADARSVTPALSVPGGVNPSRIAALAWGTASLTAMLVVGGVLLVMGWRRRRWERTGVAGTPVYVSRRFGPALVGVTRAKVVVPAWVSELEPGVRDAIIRHEEEHARARDHLALLYGGLAAAVFPWSPAIWWMCRRLRAAVEMDCDERVLASGIGVADYGTVLLNAGTRSRGWWGFVPAMGKSRSLLERRLKTMSEKQEKLGAGRAAILACVAVGALVTACDVRLPTEIGDAIDEAFEVQAPEPRGKPSGWTQGSYDGYLAEWFVSDPAPLVFVDDVPVARYEDLPESVRLWSESGLRREGVVDRVEVINGAKSREIYGDEGANGAIRIFTRGRPSVAEMVEAVAESPKQSDRDNLWGGKFSGMAESPPLPLLIIEGVRVTMHGNALDDDGNAAPWPDPTPWPHLKGIERLEVIKGAAAVALYGDEAAGGVILICLKK